MKRLFFMICSVLLLCGCGKKEITPAQVLTIGKDDFAYKVEQQDSFIFLVTRTQCEYCQQLLDMIDFTKEDYDVKIYHLEMRDDTIEHYNEDLAFLKEYVERPDQTPHYYYFEDGEVIAHQMGYTSLNPDRFWEWYESLNID